MFLPNLQPAQPFTGDSLTLQPCEKAGISHDIRVIILLLARSLENCKIFCLKQREFHPTFCRNVQGKEKIEGCSAVSRGLLLKDRKKKKAFLFESISVLLSSLQCRAVTDR